MIRYFEVFYEDTGNNIEEIFSVHNATPFPLISIDELVIIDAKEYRVFRRAHRRSKSEITVNYYVSEVTAILFDE